MKHFVKFSVVALAAMTAGLLNSCTENEALTPDGTAPVIKLLKAPDVIAYSGSNVWGSTIATRGHDVNGNLWYQNWDRPTNVTEEEIAKVLEAVKEPRVNATNDITIEWENFWVQQVYKGQTSYSDHYENDRGLGSDLMNELQVWNDNAEVWWPEHKFGGYETVNNFNRGDNQTSYIDDENRYEYKGTTLMTGIAGGNAENQFAYKNSADGGQLYFDYIVVEIDGSYYVCFDFFADNRDNPTATANKDHYIDRDWVFNDWIVKISPAYHKGETPEQPEPEQPEKPGSDDDKCDQCDHSKHDGETCPDCKDSNDGCYQDDDVVIPTDPDPDPETPGDNTGDVDHTDEVEVNLSVEDKGGHYDSHLSIHVRAATDVEVFIPIPMDYLVQKDDMAILISHKGEGDIAHGGHLSKNVVTYTVSDGEGRKGDVTLTISYEEDGIRITTDGITEDIIDICQKKYDDGITFEIWNYINDELPLDEIKKYLNNATIKFLDKEPDYYINAFTEDGKDNYDCTVSIVEEQEGDFDDLGEGKHLNGSNRNEIYKNKKSE